MKKRFFVFLLILGVILLACVLFTATATPANWLYQHNYYFQNLVDALHR